MRVRLCVLFLATFSAPSLARAGTIGSAKSTTHSAVQPNAIEIEFPSELDLSIAEAAPVALSARWVRGASSETTEGPVLHAWASFGEIRNWNHQGQVWSGQWVPPEPLVPGHLVVVVSALVKDRAIFSAQDISVSAEIVLPGHSEPGAEVTILLAGEKFGPQKAGKDGRFSMRVRVPPGVQEATAQSRDALGNTFKRKVNLFVPKTSRLGLVCPAAVVAAGERVPIVLATDRAHTGQVSYAASQGRVELAHFLAPEKLQRGDTEAAHVTLTAHSSVLGDAACVVDVVPLPAVQMQAAFVPPYILSDGRSEASLLVIATDKFGNPTTDANVRFTDEGAATKMNSDDKRHAFVAQVVSRAGTEQRSFAVSASPWARRCEQRELGNELDFRGVSCVPPADKALVAHAVLEQIPSRGVVLRAQRLPNGGLSVVVTPPGEANANAVKAVDDRGVSLVLSPGTHTGELLTAPPASGARFVSFTHLKSGVSVMVTLGDVNAKP